MIRLIEFEGVTGGGHEKSVDIYALTTEAFEQTTRFFEDIEACDVSFFTEDLNSLCQDIEKYFQETGKVEPPFHHEKFEQIKVLQLIVEQVDHVDDYWPFIHDNIHQIFLNQIFEFEDYNAAAITLQNVLSVGVRSSFLGAIPKDALKLAIESSPNNDGPDILPS